MATRVRLYREGLADCLQRHEGIAVLGTAGAQHELLQLIESSNPEAILLDLSMVDDIEFLATLTLQEPGRRVIAFAIDPVDERLLACARCNVAGYLSIDCTVEQVVATIQQVMNGGTHCHPSLTAVLLHRFATLADAKGQRSPLADLTPRQREIAVLMRSGLSNKEIASHLAIEVSTVKNHVHVILDKLRATRRAEVSARLMDSK